MIWRYVIQGEPDDCWPWTGQRGRAGRGRIEINGKYTAAPRAVWQVVHGPIPDGLFVCHTCDNPNCVNPAHLWLGTNQDNILDASRKGRLWQAKDTCKRGHKLEGDNLGPSRRGYRVCKACHALDNKEYRRRNYEKVRAANRDRWRRNHMRWRRHREATA